MRIDPLLKFCLDIPSQEFLTEYETPGERAVLKGVPITEVERARKILNSLGLRVRARYRGPRRDRQKLFTLKRHATHASFYTKPAKIPCFPI